MATKSKNSNTGLEQTPGAFAPSFAGGMDFAVVTWLGGSSSQGMGDDAIGGDENLGGVLLDLCISGSPEGRPSASISQRSHYQNQTEYGPPIVSTRGALKRIPN